MQQIATDTLIKIYRRMSSTHGNGPHAHCGHIKKSHILDEIMYLKVSDTLRESKCQFPFSE